MKNDIKQILVIRLSSLGDILLTTPVLRSLKYLYSDCQITFLCKNEYLNAVINNPNINNFIALKAGINEQEVIEKISKEKFDLILDFQNNLRSRQIIKGIKIPLLRFKKPTLKKFLLVNLKLNLFGRYLSIPELYAHTLPGLALDDYGVDLFVPQEYITLLNKDEKYIGFIPGSKHFSKRWPDEYFIQLGKLLNKYGYTIVLFGGKDDKNICGKINAEITKSKNLCNDNNLYQTVTDMRQCSIIIGNDSGLIHAASSLPVPLIVLFGSSVEEFGFAPYRKEAVIIQNEALKCRPCSHFGRNECPKKHFDCMNGITPNIVFEKIKKTLAL